MAQNNPLQQWDVESQQPAAPAGLQQAAGARHAAGAHPNQPAMVDNPLAQWDVAGGGPGGYLDQAQSWYTGANNQGTSNGWSSQFTEDFIAGQNQAAKDGTLGTYFDGKDATGVVTWDHASTDGTEQYKFGDVYDHGKKQGNLYDQFDKPTADLMMSDWLFDARTKAEIFSDDNPTDRMRREVSSKQAQNNTEIPKALQAADFQKDVTQRAQEFEEGGADDSIVAAGALGGGTLGAGIGTVVAPGIGTVIGGGIGGLIGGVAAYMNKDSLTEQAARAYEITAMSSRENGTFAGIATGVQQWSGFGGSLINPLTNLNQGLVDWQQGDVGDNKAAYFHQNKKGESTRPGWSTYTNFGAMVADSLIQFATPVGVAAYTGQMSGSILGEVAEMGLTGGKSFDYTRGGFDNVFTDENGHFDASAAIAGVGKVGIDVVQLGFARGIAGKTDAALAEAGEKAAYGSVRISAERLPSFLGGHTEKEAAALAGGGRMAEAGGMRYAIDAKGKVVSRRATLSILAPSEMLNSLSARVLAIRDVAKTKGAYDLDTVYQAAHSLSVGERKIATVLTNAMGEGSEEAMQEVFDEHSHGNRIDFTSIEQAAVGGFAAGAGMGFGTAVRAPSADARLLAYARLSDPTITDEEWKAMPETQKRLRSAQTDAQRKSVEAAFGQFVDDQNYHAVATVGQVNRLADAQHTALDSAAKTVTDKTDRAIVITQIEDAGRLDENGNLMPDSVPNDAVTTSLRQLVNNLNNHLRGMLIAKDKFAADIKALDPNDPATADALAELQRKVEVAENVQVWGRQVQQYLDPVLERVYGNPDTGTLPMQTLAEVQSESEALNHLLRQAYNRTAPEWLGSQLTDEDKYSLARAVSHVFVRDPQDQSGSFQVLVPQMSPMLTWSGSDDVAQVSHALLNPLSGDFDGDKIRQQAQLILDDTEFESARAGTYYIGAGTSVNIPAPKYEEYIVHYMSQALRGADETMQAYASGVMLDITDAIRRRYDGVVDDAVLEKVSADFYSAVHRGDKDSRKTLLDGLALDSGTTLDSFARENLSNEWLWIDQLVRATMQEFQVAFVEYRDVNTVPNTTKAPPHLRDVDTEERIASEAATMGQQMGLLLPGDSLFRMFQKLHFSALASKALTAEQAGQRVDVAAMAAFYEALGQMVTQSEIDAVRGKDNITNTVYAQLRRIAESGRVEMSKTLGRKVDITEALAVIANMAVVELDVDSSGHYLPNSNKTTLSLTQLLLKREIAVDKRRNARIIDLDTDLQAKYKKLDRMVRPQSRTNKDGAERSFLEVAGDQTMYALLGSQAGTFSPHLTVNQFLRGYISMSERDRKDEKHRMTEELAYLGRDQTKNMPYTLKEISKGQITAYRSVVDAILAVGNGTISMSADGTVTGEAVERSDSVGASFRDAHANMVRLVDQMVELGGRKKGEKRIDLVQRVLKMHPELDTAVAELVPKEYARYATTNIGGQLKTASWVFNLFDEKMTSEAVEMAFLRNIIMTGWRAAGVDPKAEAGDEGQKSREFNRLTSRWHRVMWMASAQPDGGILFKNLMVAMQEATSVKEFEHWVNTTPGIRGNQAPLVAWVDDTAEFDKDKSNGGWTTSLRGSSLREAIRTLQTTTENLVADMGKEREAWDDDQRILSAIDNGDAALTAQMQTALEQAQELADGVGPNSQLMQTAFAAWSFYGQAHNKGKNPLHTTPDGLYDAHRDAYGFLSNYERMMASLTSTNLSAISQHLSHMPKDSGRTMTDDGRPVEFNKYTVAEIVSLMKDPETRAYARAYLYPQVLEATPTGQLSTQMVVGRSLKDLLSGTSFNNLYEQWDLLNLDQAFRYGTMIEAMARKYGGHFSIQRLANDMTIAQLSGATQVLSFEDVVDMATRNYYEIAQILQATSSIAAQQHNIDDGTLARLKEEFANAQRTAHAKSVLNLPFEIKDAVLNEMVDAREKEVLQEVKDIKKRITDQMSEAEEAAIVQQAARAYEQFLSYRRRLDLLSSDNSVDQVVAMFALPADPADADLQVSFVQNYIMTLGIDVFRQKASASTSTLREYASKVTDSKFNGVDMLTYEQWQELSRAAIGIYLDELGSVTPATVSVPPFPDMDSEVGRLQSRYWDSSFSYLLDAFFDADSPILQAGVELHRRAGRQNIETEKTELADLLARTMLKDGRFGQWTSEVSRGSIFANSGLDAAAAAPAVAIAGDSPKRQATESAACERTFAQSVTTKDDAGNDVTVSLGDRVSTASLSWLDMENHDKNSFTDFNMTLPNGQDAQRPLAQLNNRFARSVRITYIDTAGAEQQMELLTGPDSDRNLGRPFPDPKAAGSGFEAIHLERVKQAIQAKAELYGFNAAGVDIQIEFLHPDHQPSGPEWTNNLFFEGTSFQLAADRHDSLNSTLWFVFGGISPTLQAQALQASKKGKQAMRVIKLPADSVRQAIEMTAALDLAGVLRNKAKLMLETDLGFGRLDIEAFNAVYKNLKMRHFFRGLDADGNPVMWSAERVIEFQQANPGADLPFTDARLWVPTDQMLRDFLGEVGQQGVAARTSDPELEITKVSPYRGVTPAMMAQIADGLVSDGEITDTDVIHRARMGQMQVRGKLSKASMTAFETQMEYFAKLREEIGIARTQTEYQTDFSIHDNLTRAVAAGGDALQAENILLDLRSEISFAGPRNTANLAAEKLLLASYGAILKGTAHTTGWVFEEGVTSDLPKGLLTGISLSDDAPVAFRIAPGDLVTVRVEAFKGDMELAQKRLNFLVGRGANIVLGDTRGSNNEVAQLGAYLHSRAYARVPGSKHVYAPENLDARYQNVRARMQAMTESRVISPRNQLMNLLVEGLPIEENAAWVNYDNPNLQTPAMTMNLVPTDWLYGFNVPVNDASDDAQVGKVIQSLRSLDTTEGRTFLRDMARPKDVTDAAEILAHDQDWDKSWKAMIRRFDETEEVLPRRDADFGTGDFIPLLGPNDRILLYRHGYEAPFDRTAVNAMANMNRPGTEYAMNVAIYPSIINAAATTHRGKVVSIDPRSAFGLQMELNIDLQTLGGKVIFEWNGMKYVLSPKPDHIKLPDHSVFLGGRGIDMVSSLADAISKESFGGTVNNHRNAFAYFGIDFMPDVAKFLGVTPDRALTVLNAVAKRADRISIAEADQLIAAGQVGPFVSPLLETIALQNEDVDLNWVDRLDGEASVEAQITKAMMIYLMTEGAQVKFVLKSGGFNDMSSSIDSVSRLMPPLFTQAFDRAPPGSKLRAEMNRRFNEQLHNPKHDGTGYSLSEMWDFTVHNNPAAQTDAVSYDIVNLTTVVAYVGTKPVGRMTFSPVSGEIGTIGVLPDYQRQGLATGMMKYAEAQGHAITHNAFRTAEGEAWARAVTGDPGEQFFHGSEYEITGDLLPRDQSISRTGTNIGPGFYTTSDPTKAKYYAGSDGYTYVAQAGGKVFDLATTATAADLRALAAVMHGLQQTMDPADYGYQDGPGDLADKLEQRATDGTATTWTDVFHLAHGFREPVSQFLEDTKKVDALKGTEETVWLRPEKLKLQKWDEAAAPAAGGLPPQQAFVDANAEADLKNDLKRIPDKTVTQGTGQDLVGMLQFSEAHFASENPVFNGQAFDGSQKQGYSSHSAAIAYQSTGGDTVYKYDIAAVRNAATGVRAMTTADVANGNLWKMLTDIDRKAVDALADWRAESPAESGRRKLARESMVMFRKALTQKEDDGWDDELRNAYLSIKNEILHEYGLDVKQGVLVDYWVRQMAGEALGKDNEGIERGNVSGSWAIQNAQMIRDNAKSGALPAVGAQVPVTHINDLQALYRANRGKDGGWHPAESPGDPDTKRAESWDDWVNISLGGIELSDDLFDPLFLMATDGFFHGYQNATRSLLDLPVSLDRDVQRRLLDPATNMRLVSINPHVQTTATSTLIVDFDRAGLSDLISGVRMTGEAPAGARAKKTAQLLRWRRENRTPIPRDQTMTNFRKNGIRLVDTSTRANALSRSLINLRVGTAMINPALYFSMGPEQWVRGSLDRLANTVTLQSTAVRINKKGEAVGTAARMAQVWDALDETKVGSIMESLGISYRYSRDQLKQIGGLSEALGDNLDFKAMVYSDLMFLRPHAPDVGKIEHWLSNYAKFGARMQDPTWGMRAKTLGRRYVEAVLQHLEATPTLHNLTPEMLVAEMMTDPTFLQKNYPAAHRAGTNAIAQLRSLKATTASKMLKGIYEPMAESDHAGVNFFGNVVLKMPLIFSGYALNVATTITGMQGADQMVAAFFHGRNKGFIGKMQARLRGDAFNPETDSVFDFSDVLEGADLTRAFIRGGLTHAGLFYFGMMASGLGLSGEDDETKKRRRMSQLQGAGFVYDPRALENDFRNSDAVFLDFLPMNLGSYFSVNNEGQDMAQLHWMLKQFVSPILGMEKFYETGDFRQVTWGFEDALGSFPLINSLSWSDAVSTAHEFAKMAHDNDKATLGGPEGMPATAALLANGVGIYERMLFENSFVNALYTGLDRYDRDPYVLPLRDSDGTIQRTIDNQARAQDISLQPYVDPETHEIKTGYVGRDTSSGTWHALTENRASLAFVSALFTGMNHSDYIRYNMPVKTREIDKPVMTQGEAEALLHLFTSREAQPAMTEDELAAKYKNQAFAGGSPNWDLYNAADELAKQYFDPHALEPLSAFTADDREVLTHSGARAIYRGLIKGSVPLNSEALAGIYIPYDMRVAIQTEWTKEIVQEGIDMGLDKNKATSRMKRLWGGPYGDETIQGIGDILFSKDISFSPSVQYRQLNTTYVMGPDGRPWATGFTRDGLFGALGLQPLKRAYTSEQPDTTGTDERLNTTDFINRMNTGLRGLELIDDSINVPTDVEIGKAIEDAIKKAAASDYTPYSPYKNGGGSRYNGYGRHSYGGGGGGYSSSGYANFSKMYNLPGGVTPYANEIPFINTTNPIIRRADVRRERVWSERGRLKQWQ